MFVKTSLGLPRASTSEPQHVALEPSPFFDTISWQHEPAIMYEEDGCTYGQFGARMRTRKSRYSANRDLITEEVMHMSKLAASPEHFATWGAHRQIRKSSEASYAMDKQETGSDASTADTSPYFVDEGFYMDGRSADYVDITWNGGLPPGTADLPFPTFAPEFSHQQQPMQQPWQQTGWTDFGIYPDVPQTEIFTAGSAKHQLGQCKPCAFSWKPEGCQSGTDCKFCHLCPPGEKQRRKKVLRQLQRNVGPCK